MTADCDWGVAHDADLVDAAAAGDRAAFASIYDRYSDRLYDFCVGMVGVHDAADCVQEAFVTAAVDLPTLRDPGKLRPWLYAIARHQALRTLRHRRRETTSDDLPDEPSRDAGPDTLAVRNELATLVAQAEQGVSDRDREVLDLVYRHGLVGAELAEALGVSTDAAKKMVQRLRHTVERSLGALLIARQARAGRHRCTDLEALVADWDGQFTILVRKRISRHVENCRTCDGQRRRLVNPAALLGASPVLVPAPTWLRAKTLAPHLSVAARVPLSAGRFAMWAAAVVAIPAVAIGVAVGWPTLGGESTTPIPVSLAPVTSMPLPTLAPAPPLVIPPSAAAPIPAGPAPAPVPAPIPAPAPPSMAPSASAAPSTLPSIHRSTQQSTPPPITAAPTIAAPRHQPSKPTVTHCADGSTVASGQSCPVPQLPPTQNCPHVAVPGNPVCGRTTGH